MGRAKSKERLHLEELLSTDTWHDREELFYKWSEKINPAKAQRAAAKAYKSKGQQRSKEVTDQQLEMFGARHIYNQLLGSLRSFNRIEERKVDGSTQIRFLSEEVTADLDSYTSIIVLDEVMTDRIVSMHDPKGGVLVVSLMRLENWSDKDLNLLVSWCKVREDESDAFALTKLMALKVLKTRTDTFSSQPKQQRA